MGSFFQLSKCRIGRLLLRPAPHRSRFASQSQGSVDWQAKFWEKDAQVWEKDAQAKALIDNFAVTQANFAVTQANFAVTQANILSAWKDKEVLWRTENDRLRQEVLSEKIKMNSVVQMRVLVELAAKHVHQGTTATDACNKVVKALKADDDLYSFKLNEKGKSFFNALLAVDPVIINERQLCTSLHNFYHDLSKELHFLPSGPEGAYISGSDLERFCAGMFVLYAQETHFPVGPIYLLNGRNQRVAKLQNSKVERSEECVDEERSRIRFDL